MKASQIVLLILAVLGMLAAVANAQECYDNAPMIRAHYEEEPNNCVWHDWYAVCGYAPGTNEPWRILRYLDNEGPSSDGTTNVWAVRWQTCLEPDFANCGPMQRDEVACVCDTCNECFYQ